MREDWNYLIRTNKHNVLSDHNRIVIIWRQTTQTVKGAVWPFEEVFPQFDAIGDFGPS